MDNQLLLYAVPFSGVIALLYALFKAGWVSKQDTGTEDMATIAGHIADGAVAFLKREYKVLVIFVICVAVLLGFANTGRTDSSPAAVGIEYEFRPGKRFVQSWALPGGVAVLRQSFAGPCGSRQDSS